MRDHWLANTKLFPINKGECNMEQKFDIVRLFSAIIFIVVVATIAVGLIATVSNETNRITEGLVVDKEYTSGYAHASGANKSLTYRNVPPSYYLILSGEKNGKPVRYRCEVTEAEYEATHVGDYYRK